MNLSPMPSESDGADYISATLAMAAEAETIDELDQEALTAILDEIEITECETEATTALPDELDQELTAILDEWDAAEATAHRSHRTAEPEAAPVAPHRTLMELADQSAQKLLPGRKHAVTALVITENARAAEAGERVRTDRRAVRKRLDQRAHRSHRTTSAVPAIDLDPRTLPADVVGPIVAEAKERLAALTGAMRADPKSKRYIRLRDRQGELTRWWAARRMARAKLRREASQSELATLVRCFMIGFAGKTTKRHAQSALDLIRKLEQPGGPWYRFTQEKTAHV